MKSPLTGGRVKEIKTIEVKEFRGEMYRVPVEFYVCEDTGEQFTTTEQDTKQFNDLYSQYRRKHGIPTPEEIKDIRINYGLSYSQIALLLGISADQYANYESGEVPTEANGKKIASLKDKRTLMSLLTKCKRMFQKSEYDNILNTFAIS